MQLHRIVILTTLLYNCTEPKSSYFTKLAGKNVYILDTSVSFFPSFGVDKEVKGEFFPSKSQISLAEEMLSACADGQKHSHPVYEHDFRNFDFSHHTRQYFGFSRSASILEIRLFRDVGTEPSTHPDESLLKNESGSPFDGGCSFIRGQIDLKLRKCRLICNGYG